VISPVLSKLLDGIVIGEHITVDAPQKRDVDFEDRNEEVVGGFTDWPMAH